MGRKYTYEEVTQEFKKSNLTLLEKEYLGSNTPMKFICNKHPDVVQSTSLANLKHGASCRFCSSHDKYPEDFETEFYAIRDDIKLLSQYIGYEKKISCQCKICNFIWDARAGKLLIGRGCPECAKKIRGSKKRLNWSIIDKEFKNRNIQLLTKEDEFETATKTVLRYMCPKHGEKTIKWNHFRQGKGCRDCWNEIHEGRLAIQLKDKCKEKYPDTIIEYRVLKNPLTGMWLPYDIYIPTLNVYVEVQGRQHYEYKNTWGEKTFEKLEYQWYKDELKELYAWENGRYVEIDTRTIKTVDDAMKLIEFGRSETANLAGLMFWTDEIKAKTPMPIYN